MLKADGLTVKQIKVEKGCYEVYATDKAGKRHEHRLQRRDAAEARQRRSRRELIGRILTQ